MLQISGAVLLMVGSLVKLHQQGSLGSIPVVSSLTDILKVRAQPKAVSADVGRNWLRTTYRRLGAKGSYLPL